MLARQLMQKDLITILPSSTMFDAAVKMKEHHVGSVLVVEEGWKLKGILTDRDIAMTVAADTKDPRTISVRDVMTADPITINSDADVEIRPESDEQGAYPQAASDGERKTGRPVVFG